MKYLIFETELFFDDITDDQLGLWDVGADCAGWFYARLLPFPAIKYKRGPSMIHGQWVMAVKVYGVVVEIVVSGNEKSYIKKNTWVLFVHAKEEFLKWIDQDLMRAAEGQVEHALKAIIESDSRFVMVTKPFDLESDERFGTLKWLLDIFKKIKKALDTELADDQ